MYELSIVTPLFNKWNFTKSYLDDLKFLDAKKVQIILIDNASTDETTENLKVYEDSMNNLKVIHNNQNMGFGKACNIGYEASSGTHIMFLNNDIRVKDNKNNWTDAILAQCTENNLVSPTGGKVDPNNNFQFMYETADSGKDINYLSGWCIIGHRKVWDQLIEDTNVYNGPFSEQYFCYFEDTHLSFMARSLRIDLCMHSIPVVHFGKVSSKQLNTYELYSKSRIIFQKNWKNNKQIDGLRKPS